MTGVPARCAAIRPSAPAFALCVWTTSNARCLHRSVRRRSAMVSSRGEIGETREGSRSTSMPRSAAVRVSSPPSPVITVTW